MTSDFRASFTREPNFTAVFSSSEDFGANMGNVTRVTTGNYNELANKPKINGVELTGNKSGSELFLTPSINGVELTGDKSSENLHIVSENTTAGWNALPQYLPKKGEICVYTDYMTVQDDMGNDITYPGIKVGDGNAYLIDSPFVGEETRYLLLQRIREHEYDSLVHVSQADRDFWNNKLNYDVDDEVLVFNRN